MFFSDASVTILIWIIMIPVAAFTSYWLAQSDNPVDLFTAKDISGCVKFIGLISIQIIVLAVLILNWCNAAVVTLVTYALTFVSIFIDEKSNGDRIWPILCIFAMGPVAGMLVMTCTQTYMPASKQIEDHKITFYQIKDIYEYGYLHTLQHRYTIKYICEDPNYSGEINLNDDTISVRFCIDPENPRIEEITYSQEYIEHVITGGTINFGSKETLKETVLYLPNTDFLTPPPALPDESSK